MPDLYHVTVIAWNCSHCLRPWIARSEIIPKRCPNRDCRSRLTLREPNQTRDIGTQPNPPVKQETEGKMGKLPVSILCPNVDISVQIPTQSAAYDVQKIAIPGAKCFCGAGQYRFKSAQGVVKRKCMGDPAHTSAEPSLKPGERPAGHRQDCKCFQCLNM